MDVLAEGLEQLDEARWLHLHDRRYAQGYLFAKAKPFSTALGYLQRDYNFM